MRRVAATILFALTLVVGVAPVTAGGAVAAEPRAVGTPHDWARRLILDLQNDADPADDRLSELVFLLTIDTHRSVGADIEWLQRRPEGRLAVVDDLFVAVLRREADAGSRTFFADRLARIGRQKVMADLLASSEHRTRQGGGTDAGWLDALYRDALGRPADAAGLQYFLGELDRGRTRGSIASFFTGGAEGRTALVRRLMGELLRRPADAPSVRYYAGRLAAGTSVERVVALIASSEEYLDGSLAPLPSVDAVLLHRESRLELRRIPYGGIASTLIEVTGLAAGDDLVAIDVRPATGGLYGLTETGQVVAITPGGAATPVGAPLGGLDPEGSGLTVDAGADVLVVTSGAAVRRVDPDTGVADPAVTAAYAAGDLHAGAVPQLAAASVVGTTGYAVDAAADTLVIHGPEGVLRTVGPLHADTNPRAGLDVDPGRPGAAYAVLTVAHAGRSLWRIDLATGAPGFVQDLGDSVIDLAVVGDPAVVPVEPAYGITPGATPELRRFATDDPTPTATWPVAGITAGTEVVGLDVRPSTGGLHGIGSDGQVYALPVPSGAGPVVATPLGSPLPGFDPADGVGFEVEPADDAVRVVNGDRSHRVRISDGALVGDGAEPPGTIEWTAPEGTPPPLHIDGTASTHGQRGAPAPPPSGDTWGARSFHIDPTQGLLVLEQVRDPLRVVLGLRLFPEGGTVVDEVVGFDITGGLRHVGYALFEIGGRQTVTTVDLVTGEATPVADLTEAPQRVYSAFALA